MRALLWLSLLVIGSGLPLSARADAHSERAAGGAETATYKAAVNAAIEEFEHGNFAEAREHFSRAHAVLPNARTLRGLGMSDFELRNYVDALAWLEQAIASREKPLEGTLREETLALLKRAQAYVGTIVLKLVPATTRVHVDGFSATSTAEGRVRLAVGDHVLELSADGHLSERRAIKIRGEQQVELRVALTPAPVEATTRPVVASAPARDEPVPLHRRWWLWTSVGAVVVAAGVAGALLAARKTSVQQPSGGSTGDNIVLR